MKVIVSLTAALLMGSAAALGAQQRPVFLRVYGGGADHLADLSASGPAAYFMPGYNVGASAGVQLPVVLVRVRVTMPPGSRRLPVIDVCEGERIVTKLTHGSGEWKGELLLPLLPGTSPTLRVSDPKLEITGGEVRVDASMREVSLALVERR